MKKGLVTVLALAAATAALWPAAGGAATFKGIVVAKQHGALLVASPTGLVRTVHANAGIGARISLAGGTATVVGHASHARIRGIVVRRIGRTLVLSSNRHLIAIPNRVGRVLASASDTPPAPTSPPTGSTTTTTTPPAPGAVVTTDVSLTGGTLEEDDETQVGQVTSGSVAVTATIKAVGAGTVTLDVQGQSVTVPLPAGLTLPATLVGQTVTLNLSVGGADNQQGDDNEQGGSGSGGDDSGSGGSGDNGGGGDH